MEKYTDALSIDVLSRAWINGEFKPYIQPIIRATDRTIVGGELLIRWHTADGNIICPVHFLDKLESFELLPLITRKIMTQTVSEISAIGNKWSQGFQVAVNVTPVLLMNRGFIGDCLSIAGMRNIKLILELTEKESFNIDCTTTLILQELSDAGVEFALDDFGTKCSVLSYLKYFPIRYIKIDKMFIQDIILEKTSSYIVETIVRLSKRLDISTVAEGVETCEQLETLNTLGVDYYQGFHIGKPYPINIFIKKFL